MGDNVLMKNLGKIYHHVLTEDPLLPIDEQCVTKKVNGQ